MALDIVYDQINIVKPTNNVLLVMPQMAVKSFSLPMYYDPNKDPRIRRELVEHFYHCSRHKWLRKDYKSIWEYFKVYKKGENTIVEPIDDVNKLNKVSLKSDDKVQSELIIKFIKKNLYPKNLFIKY